MEDDASFGALSINEGGLRRRRGGGCTDADLEGATLGRFTIGAQDLPGSTLFAAVDSFSGGSQWSAGRTDDAFSLPLASRRTSDVSPKSRSSAVDGICGHSRGDPTQVFVDFSRLSSRSFIDDLGAPNEDTKLGGCLYADFFELVTWKPSGPFRLRRGRFAGRALDCC